MRYRIVLYRDNTQYTAYEGNSRSKAQATVDLLRSTLIMGTGTADIWVSYHGAGVTRLYEVIDGMATHMNSLEE